MMQMDPFVIGLDFGTLSGRAVLVRTRDGLIQAESVKAYTHGVMDKRLPDGTPLPSGWALQHPSDYMEVLFHTVREVLAKGGIPKERVIGLGVDFTGSTVVPVDGSGQPLCLDAAYQSRPHAWVKLWKHHAAQLEADAFTKAARERDPDLLARNGGKISPECLFPKALQMLHEDPELYAVTDRFMEACDWITLQLTGKPVRSSAVASLKAFWREGIGYPAKTFLASVDPAFEDFVEQKLRGEMQPLGTAAGGLLPDLALSLGLAPHTAVAVPQLDAHASLPALGITEPGKALLTLGTSTGIILAYPEKRRVEGACSIAEGGNLPGLWGYASGQYCAGDLLQWFVDCCVPAAYRQEASRQGKDLHTCLSEKAAALKPGESGLLALDWWNGNRSVLADTNLSGLLLGMTLHTSPEEIYRALMEAIAFGMRKIIESYEEAGITIGELYACGGIAKKNPLMLQILSDVLKKRISISAVAFAPAIGAAMLASAAAGEGMVGHASLLDASRAMSCLSTEYFDPTAANVRVYDRLYQEYEKLHDYFGRYENPMMINLKNIKNQRA